MGFSNRRFGKLGSQEGFTIIELVAAMAVFALAAGFVLTVLVAGIRTAGFGRDRTVAKELNREKLEEMRRLPFYIQHGDGQECVPEVKVDLLDQYFPNLDAPRYSSADDSFTRTIDPVPGFPGYSMTIKSQFIDAPADPSGGLQEFEVLTPDASYDCTSSTSDTPPSRTLRAEVTIVWGANDQHEFTLSTFLGEGRLGDVEVQGSASTTLVKIDGAFRDSSALIAEAGISSVSLFVGNTVSSRADFLAARAQIIDASGGIAEALGARVVLGAPPNAGPTTITDGAGGSLDYPSSGPVIVPGAVTFGPGQSKDVEVAAGSGPLKGLGSLRLRHDKGDLDSGDIGLTATNEVSALDGRDLDTTKPFVRLQKIGGPTKPAILATDCTEGLTTVTCESVGSMAELRLVPVTYLPAGNATDGYLVTLSFDTLRVEAVASREQTGGSAIAEFSGTLRYWEWDTDQTPSAYVLETVSISSSGGGALPSDADLGNICVRANLLGACNAHLGDYILTWSSLSGGITDVGADHRNATASLDGVVRITTQPTDLVLPSSGFILKTGTLSATAVDNR